MRITGTERRESASLSGMLITRRRDARTALPDQSDGKTGPTSTLTGALLLNLLQGHAEDTRLRRLAKGDQIAFYSPRTALRSGEPLQQFTALATADPSKAEPFRALAPGLQVHGSYEALLADESLHIVWQTGSR